MGYPPDFTGLVTVTIMTNSIRDIMSALKYLSNTLSIDVPLTGSSSYYGTDLAYRQDYDPLQRFCTIDDRTVPGSLYPDHYRDRNCLSL